MFVIWLTLRWYKKVLKTLYKIQSSQIFTICNKKLYHLGDRTNRSVTSIFLVSLAIADLLLLMISAPLDVAQYFVIQWDHEGTVCKLATFAESVSAFASVLNLVAVTFER